jgi:hypothetical protein
LTTGGAHGFPTTFGLVKGGIELDMLNFNKVVVDAKTNKLTIGGGVRFGDILGPMTQAKKEMGKFPKLSDRHYPDVTCLRLGSDWSGELCGYDWSHAGWWCQSI